MTMLEPGTMVPSPIILSKHLDGLRLVGFEGPFLRSQWGGEPP